MSCTTREFLIQAVKAFIDKEPNKTKRELCQNDDVVSCTSQQNRFWYALVNRLGDERIAKCMM